MRRLLLPFVCVCVCVCVRVCVCLAACLMSVGVSHRCVFVSVCFVYLYIGFSVCVFLCAPVFVCVCGCLCQPLPDTVAVCVTLQAFLSPSAPASSPQSSP
jgi:hypothetical protein